MFQIKGPVQQLTAAAADPPFHDRIHPRRLNATEHPVQAWVVQQARNLLMDLEDTGTRVKFVLHDRDASSRAPGLGFYPRRSRLFALWVPKTY